MTMWGLRVGGNKLPNLLKPARSPHEPRTIATQLAAIATEAVCEYPHVRGSGANSRSLDFGLGVAYAGFVGNSQHNSPQGGHHE